MTLDQSLANLQHQADRLAGIFAATSDAIEAGRAHTAAEAAVLANPHVSNAIRETFAGTAETVQLDYHGVGQAVDLPVPLDVRRDTPAGVVATTDGSLINFEGENYVPQTPQGASPSSAPPMATPTASAVEVEGPGAATPETPRPAVPNPFEQTAPAPASAPAEKKKGRRTHEELAADAGVDLADVKRWLGDKKVTKAAIEEFAALKNAGVAAAAANPIGITTPPDGSHIPQAVSDPFGQGVPQTATPAPQWPTGPDGQPLPVSHPVAQAQAAVAPTPSDPFAQGQSATNPWEGQDQQPITDWSPFSG